MAKIGLRSNQTSAHFMKYQRVITMDIIEISTKIDHIGILIVIAANIFLLPNKVSVNNIRCTTS